MAFVFDGCTVTFRYVGGRSPDDPWRYLRGAGLEGVRYTDYGDPPPYYRATARWEGDTLIASSVIAPDLPIARWAAGRFVMRHGPRHAFRRVTRAADLDEQLRAMLCVERRVPTERELFRARGQTARREHVPNGWR
ncbi:MAG: hypothetical protein EVA89_09140 [Sandaracinaceae bacterium]|nr:MAG: hypothetical protein EVA89_09140 [Sandaracinaceae bacterium]